MACTEALRRDHEGVVEAADAATGMAVEMIQGRSVPRDDLQTLLVYVRSFIEQVHHRREEEVLFPIVASRMPHLAGECDRLKQDHRRAHDLIETVASSETDVERSGEVLAEWARLVRAHTREEEHYLLPIVERSLSSEACLRVRSGLARMERPGRERLVDPLTRRYVMAV